MYTGLIFHTGTIEEIQRTGESHRLIIAAPTIAGGTRPGSSVNVNGVCLTVVTSDTRAFTVDVMPQTLSLTTIALWRVGTLVNLEPSLRIGDEMGGHLVYGHVDGTAQVVDIRPDVNARWVTVRPPSQLLRYLAPQGSIAIDGVSLTVAILEPSTCSVSLIPETLRRTTLGERRIGDSVNIEVDMAMKHLDRLLTFALERRDEERSGTIDYRRGSDARATVS